VTSSLGITEYRLGEDLSETISRADKALYRAKDAGRNRVECA
jgi:PleD family two-component response regulator